MLFHFHWRSTAVIISSLSWVPAFVCGELLFRIKSMRCLHQSSCEFLFSRPIFLKPLALSFWMLSLACKTVIAPAVAWVHSAVVPSWRRPSLVHSCLFSLPYCSFLLCRRECSCTVKWPRLQLMEWLPKTLATWTSVLGQGKERIEYKWRGRKKAEPLF